MTVIKINAITVPDDAGDELAHRFAARAGAVDGADGFEGFELLQPTDERTQWLVITRWRDEEAFQAWLASPVLRARSPLGVRAERRRGAQAGVDPQRGLVLPGRGRVAGRSGGRPRLRPALPARRHHSVGPMP